MTMQRGKAVYRRDRTAKFDSKEHSLCLRRSWDDPTHPRRTGRPLKCRKFGKHGSDYRSNASIWQNNGKTIVLVAGERERKSGDGPVEKVYGRREAVGMA